MCAKERKGGRGRQDRQVVGRIWKVTEGVGAIHEGGSGCISMCMEVV